MTNLEQAREILEQNNDTCVFFDGTHTYTSKERGVKPLLQMLQSKTDVKDFSVADKVVGKAAAFLYVLLGVKELHANVISQHALTVLQEHNIDVSYGELVEAIRNRTNTGFCPMETAVLQIEDAEAALQAVFEKQRELLTKVD